MSVQVGKLFKNRKVKDLSGQIIDWYDEHDGGWIVRSRQVVNQERWEREVQKEKDKQEAAKAIGMAKVDNNAPDRTIIPGQQKEIEALKTDLQEFKKDVGGKFDTILDLLKK